MLNLTNGGRSVALVFLHHHKQQQQQGLLDHTETPDGLTQQGAHTVLVASEERVQEGRHGSGVREAERGEEKRGVLFFVGGLHHQQIIKGAM